MEFQAMDRPLSPITERTTPGSFVPLALPLVERTSVDYTSDRGGSGSEDGSTYSKESGHTITSPCLTSATSQPVVSAAPIVPPRSSARTAPPRLIRPAVIDDSSKDISNRPPVPHRRYSARKAIPSVPDIEEHSNGEDTQAESVERHVRGSNALSGMAGVGSGMSVWAGQTQRPNSFHGGYPRMTVSPGDLARIGHTRRTDNYSNIMSNTSVSEPHGRTSAIDPRNAEGSDYLYGNATLNDFGPASLEEGRTQIDGSSQGRRRGARPYTYHASGMSEWHDSHFHAFKDKVLNAEVSGEISKLDTMASPRPLRSPRAHMDTDPVSRPSSFYEPRKRRRRLKSIFEALFGMNQSSEDAWTAQEAHHRHQSPSKDVTAAGELSTRNSKRGLGPLNAPTAGTAIRQSGTFGIQDDGSELDLRRWPKRADSLSPRPSTARDISAGGVQSDLLHQDRPVRSGAMEESATAAMDLAGRRLASPPASSCHHTTEESAASGNTFYTPFDGHLQDAFPLAPVPTTTSTNIGPKSSRTVPEPSLSSTVISASTSDDQNRLPQAQAVSMAWEKVCPAPRVQGGASRSDWQNFDGSCFGPAPVEVGKREMTDSAVQTSPSGSIGTSQPLPRLSTSTSRSTSPRPEERGAAAGDVRPSSPHLPLVIASHVLSSQASALMRHSAQMRDASEMIGQMARDSLEWGGVLLSMSQGSDRDSAPGLPEPPSADGQEPSVGLHGFQDRSDSSLYAADPLQKALDRLDRAPYPGLPERQYDSSETFARIPPRPTASRIASHGSLKGHNAPSQTNRTKHMSLPAGTQSAADSLSADNRRNHHRAEDAWNHAMQSFQTWADQAGLRGQPQTPAREDIMIWQSASQEFRPSRASDEVVRNPDDERNASGKNGLVEPARRPTGNLHKASRILVPNSGVETLLHPPPVVSHGYSDADLGFGDRSDGTARPGSHIPHDVSRNGSSKRGTGGRKLSKMARPKSRSSAPPTPSTFRRVGAGGSSKLDSSCGLITDEKVSLEGTRKHWWSRRRIGSLTG